MNHSALHSTIRTVKQAYCRSMDVFYTPRICTVIKQRIKRLFIRGKEKADSLWSTMRPESEHGWLLYFDSGVSRSLRFYRILRLHRVSRRPSSSGKMTLVARTAMMAREWTRYAYASIIGTSRAPRDPG